MFSRKKKITTLEQYEELATMLETAHDTLRSASTQGPHFLLVSYLRAQYNISTNGRVDAMRAALQLLADYDF